jgi:hypothetical protein
MVISNTLPGDADASGAWTTLWKELTAHRVLTLPVTDELEEINVMTYRQNHDNKRVPNK